jgi:hypothetical protein
MIGKQGLQSLHFGIIILQLLLQGINLSPEFSILAIELGLKFSDGV